MSHIRHLTRTVRDHFTALPLRDRREDAGQGSGSIGDGAEATMMIMALRS